MKIHKLVMYVTDFEEYGIEEFIVDVDQSIDAFSATTIECGSIEIDEDDFENSIFNKSEPNIIELESTFCDLASR